MASQSIRPATGDGSNGAAESASSAVFTPLYKQIKRLVIDDLDRGAWKPGELIPSEQELAVRFQVSQGTVRKAIDELSAENLLTRRQGKGTFVATHDEPRAQFRFLRIVPDEGEPAPAQNRFLDCRRVRATADVARVLDLKTGDTVIFVRRLLMFGAAPLVLDDIWLPGALFKGLTAERLGQHHGSMYALFESQFGTRMIRADERLRARAANAVAAKALQVEIGAPLLLVERVSFTYGERPVELRLGLCRTEQHHYRNTLT